jgi:hypothetical protein
LNVESIETHQIDPGNGEEQDQWQQESRWHGKNLRDIRDERQVED